MNILAQVVLPLVLVIMMFTMGLSIQISDLKKVVQFPKPFCLGLMLQIISLPLIAFIIAYTGVNFFNLNPYFAVGLMIIASCPGGVTSNMFTYLAKADLALSVSLTSVASLLCVLTTPFIVGHSIGYFIEDLEAVNFSITEIFYGVFFISTMPAIIGILFKHKNSYLADRLENKLKKISTVLLVLVVIAAVLKDWKLVFTSFGDVGTITIILNLSCVFFAILVSKIFKLQKSQLRAIAYECGLQSGTMGIFICLTILKDETMVVPSAVYSIFMFITGGAYLYLILRKERIISKSF